MNVPVRMPGVAASGCVMRAESVPVSPGATVRVGDPLLRLRVGELPVTLYAEIGGTLKDVRAQPGMELLAGRVIFWIESTELPPLKTVSVTPPPDVAEDSSRILFHLPIELLAPVTPLVRKLSVTASEVSMEVGIGPVGFPWRCAAGGTVLVKEGDPLPEGTPVASAGAALPVAASSAAIQAIEIPELTLSEFRSTAQRLREKVIALAELVSSAGLANSADLLRAQAARLADPRFSIAVVGEFKRGKSSFLNALAGGDFLPNDVVPCTAFACRFQYADKLQLALVAPDGSETQSPLATREEIGAELNRLTRDPNTNLREAIIRLPLPLCRDGVDLIDTPGLNDSEAMNRVTLGLLPTVDMAVLLLIPESPLSETERHFLQEHLLDRDVARIVFVLNAMDRVAPDKLPRLVQYLRTQIDHLLADRQDSASPLFAVSAKEELETVGAAGSGFVELREQLGRMLVRQQGRVILSQSMQRTGRATSEALGSVRLRIAQLSTSRERFQAAVHEVAQQLAAAKLHSNEMRRRVGEAQSQVNSAAMTEARFLSLGLLALRESLPASLPMELLHKSTDEVKAHLNSLLQQAAGKLYQQTLTKLMISLRAIYEPVADAVRQFTDRVEAAFSALTGNVYRSATGSTVAAPHVAQFAGVDQADLSGGFGIHVDLSLRAWSWLLLMESSHDLLHRTSFAASLEARALAKIKDTFGREIERQVRSTAGEGYLTARLLEIAHRPFDQLLQSFNQEMKVLLDDTNATLTSLETTAAGQESQKIQQWSDLHGRIQTLLGECEGIVFQKLL